MHVAAAGAALGLASWLQVGRQDWCLIALAIGLVLMAEVFNTAIECLARAPGSRRHPRLRDALDMAGGAVLIAAATAVVIGLLVFGRPLWTALSDVCL